MFFYRLREERTPGFHYHGEKFLKDEVFCVKLNENSAKHADYFQLSLELQDDWEKKKRLELM